MRLTFLSSVALALLAGCAGGPTREQVAAADHAACTDMGAERGTDLYTQCRMMLNERHARYPGGWTGALQGFAAANKPLPPGTINNPVYVRKY